MSFPAASGGTAAQFAAGGTGTYYPFCNAVAGAGVVRAFPPAAAAYVVGAPAVDPVLAGGTGGAGFVFGATMSLRAFPLQSCLTTLDLRLNGNSTSIAPNDLICLQPYKMDDEEVEFYASEFPTQRDNSTLYKSAILPYTVGVEYDNRNPFSNNSANSATQSRGSHVATLVYEVLNAAVVYRVYNFDITEQLVISPLVWGKSFNADGFANLVNITMNLRIQDINRAFCIASAALAPANTNYLASLTTFQWNAVAQVLPAQVNLLMQYNTQDPVLSARMGRNLFYDYDLLQVDANSNAITAGLNNASADGSWTGNTLRINTIPDQVYVYIKPRKGQFIAGGTPNLATITDSFLRITGLKVNYNNKTNLLSSYTESDLYRMTTKNGIKMSWHEWKYGVGAIVCLDICSDLGLNSDEASGQTKFNTIQISLTRAYDGLTLCDNHCHNIIEGRRIILSIR